MTLASNLSIHGLKTSKLNRLQTERLRSNRTCQLRTETHHGEQVLPQLLSI